MWKYLNHVRQNHRQDLRAKVKKKGTMKYWVQDNLGLNNSVSFNDLEDTGGMFPFCCSRNSGIILHANAKMLLLLFRVLICLFELMGCLTILGNHT